MTEIESPDHARDTQMLAGGYSLRPAALDELDIILRLRIAQNQADYQMDGVTAGDLQNSWQAPAFHIGLDHWLVRAPDGQCAAYGEVRGDGRGIGAAGAVRANPFDERRGEEQFGLSVVKDVHRILDALQVTALHQRRATKQFSQLARGLSHVFDRPHRSADECSGFIEIGGQQIG